MEDDDTGVVDDAIARIGHRLRHLRTERGLTLRDVSKRTGIATSSLSRIETGVRAVSLPQLLALAHTFHCSLDALTGRAPTGITRAPSYATPEEPRDTHIVPPAVQVRRIRVAPGSVVKQSHGIAGRVRLQVLDGSIRLAMLGRVRILHSGDEISFDAHHPHSIVSLERGSADVLAIVRSLDAAAVAA